MDIPATNTDTNYPSNGRGGITTTATSCLKPSYDGATWVITGIQTLAVEAATINMTITDAYGNTYTAAHVSSGIHTILPMPHGINMTTPAAPTLSGLAAGAWPHQCGIDMGPRFSVALASSATLSVRIYFTVS